MQPYVAYLCCFFHHLIVAFATSVLLAIARHHPLAVAVAGTICCMVKAFHHAATTTLSISLTDKSKNKVIFCSSLASFSVTGHTICFHIHCIGFAFSSFAHHGQSLCQSAPTAWQLVAQLKHITQVCISFACTCPIATMRILVGSLHCSQVQNLQKQVGSCSDEEWRRHNSASGECLLHCSNSFTCLLSGNSCGRWCWCHIQHDAMPLPWMHAAMMLLQSFCGHYDWPAMLQVDKQILLPEFEVPWRQTTIKGGSKKKEFNRWWHTEDWQQPVDGYMEALGSFWEDRSLILKKTMPVPLVWKSYCYA